ncbi:hypothetical protein AHAS_Ahas04G0126000 [Arachis hypogaea]
MHHRMVVDSPLEVVVAKRDDQILVAPPIFVCFIIDACFPYSVHSLQQHWNQTHRDRGENS